LGVAEKYCVRMLLRDPPLHNNALTAGIAAEDTTRDANLSCVPLGPALKRENAGLLLVSEVNVLDST